MLREEEDDEHFSIVSRGNCIFFSGAVSSKSGAALKGALYRAVDDYRTVNLFIESNGGDAFVAYSLHDHIRTLNAFAPINTIVDGQTRSAATIIFMAGFRRYAMPNSAFRPHQGRFSVQGSPYRFAKDEAINWERDERRARQIYIDALVDEWQKLGKRSARRIDQDGSVVICRSPEQCVNELVDTEIDLNAQETVDMGFANGIWTPTLAEKLIRF